MLLNGNVGCRAARRRFAELALVLAVMLLLLLLLLEGAESPARSNLYVIVWLLSHKSEVRLGSPSLLLPLPLFP